MRGLLVAGAVFLALLVPTVGNAQPRFANPPPQVTAAGVLWQTQGEPIFYSGDFYYPTGPNVFFDQWVMSPTSSYRGVPLYVDTTLQPYSIVYVPIGGGMMRPYERRREGALAGTAGSRTPSFPIAGSAEAPVASEAAGITTSAETNVEPVGTGGTIVPSATSRGERVATKAKKNIVESVPPPASSRGIWLAYQGARWYRAGAAVVFDADRFVPSGEYHGFVVYRDKASTRDEIYVPVVQGGPLTPYRR